jgi:hypothetical protein
MTRNGLGIGITRALSEWGVDALPPEGLEAVLRLCDDYTAAVTQRSLGKITTALQTIIAEAQSYGAEPAPVVGAHAKSREPAHG